MNLSHGPAGGASIPRYSINGCNRFHQIWSLRRQPALCGLGVREHRRKRLVDLMNDRSRQLSYRKTHESDVGPMPDETLDGLMPVRGLRLNLNVRLAVDDRNDPLADDGEIVNTQNADVTFHNYPCNAKSPALGKPRDNTDYGYL